MSKNVDILLVVTLLIRTDQDSIRVEVLVSGLKDELAVFKEPGFRILGKDKLNFDAYC